MSDTEDVILDLSPFLVEEEDDQFGLFRGIFPALCVEAIAVGIGFGIYRLLT